MVKVADLASAVASTGLLEAADVNGGTGATASPSRAELGAATEHSAAVTDSAPAMANTDRDREIREDPRRRDPVEELGCSVMADVPSIRGYRGKSPIASQ